jgi:plasmid stabilization system protein ParE
LTRRLRYLTVASRDLVEIFTGLVRQGADRAASRGLVDDLRGQCRKLATLPGQLGRPRPELAESLRSFPRGSYIIFFCYEAESLVIVRVLHAHRDIAALFGGDDDEGKAG